MSEKPETSETRLGVTVVAVTAVVAIILVAMSSRMAEEPPDTPYSVSVVGASSTADCGCAAYRRKPGAILCYDAGGDLIATLAVSESDEFVIVSGESTP